MNWWAIIWAIIWMIVAAQAIGLLAFIQTRLREGLDMPRTRRSRSDLVRRRHNDEGI